MNTNSAHWRRKQHQIYNMTHTAQDSDELTRRLFEAKNDIWNEYIESKQFEMMQYKLVDEALQKVNVEIIDKGRPAISELSKELKRLL